MGICCFCAPLLLFCTQNRTLVPCYFIVLLYFIDIKHEHHERIGRNDILRDWPQQNLEITKKLNDKRALTPTECASKRNAKLAGDCKQFNLVTRLNVIFDDSYGSSPKKCHNSQIQYRLSIVDYSISFECPETGLCPQN